MNISNISYLAFLAPLALFWQQARGFISNLFTFLIRNDVINFDSSFESSKFVEFIKSHSKELKFGNSFYDRNTLFNINNNSFCLELLEKRKKYYFLFKNKFPLIISAADRYGQKINITYLNVFKLKNIIKQYKPSYSYNNHVGFYVSEISGEGTKIFESSNSNNTTAPSGSYIASGSRDDENYISVFANRITNFSSSVFWREDELQLSQPHTKKSKFFFSQEGLEILNNVKNWINKRDWYVEREISWRRGCLLHGRPGTGKSSLILQIAKKLDIPLIIYNLNTLTDQEFEKKLKANSNEYPHILLFEEIDQVWNKDRTNKNNITGFKGLSFDVFINKLSGANSIKNCFVFMTTNHIDQLDPALIRSGRVDHIIELKPLCKDGKRFIAERMLDKWPKLIESVTDDEEITAADFENKITELALKQEWNEN